MINLSIILPTLNEKDNLEILIPDLITNLSEINNLEFEIIISDDQSTDGTKELVELINLKNNNVFYYKRKSTPSLPMSIWDGIEKSKYDYVLWMDADGSMPAKSVKDMVKILMENQDSVIIGSRFVDGGAYKGILELEEKSLIKAVLNVYLSLIHI